MASTGYATVKGVLTGDTLLLMGRSAANGPPPELQLTLSGVNAPRLARGSGAASRRPEFFLLGPTVSKTTVVCRRDGRGVRVGRTRLP